MNQGTLSRVACGPRHGVWEPRGAYQTATVCSSRPFYGACRGSHGHCWGRCSQKQLSLTSVGGAPRLGTPTSGVEPRAGPPHRHPSGWAGAVWRPPGRCPPLLGTRGVCGREARPVYLSPVNNCRNHSSETIITDAIPLTNTIWNLHRHPAREGCLLPLDGRGD